MKKVVLLIVAVAVVGWFVANRLGNSSGPAVSAPVVAAPESPLVTAAKAAPPATAAAAEQTSASPRPTAPSVTSSAGSVRLVPPAKGPIAMPLTDVVGPGRRFHDDQYGVSLTFPEGWSVARATRWGEGHRQNTVFFTPPENSQAVPSMYYQEYPHGAPQTGDAEAMLRQMAQEKETSRRTALSDYTNDPGSFVFRQVDGHPALSYFATYSRGGEIQAEYFMRILGDKGYVMFFVRGPVKDVQALIPPVYDMGGTVHPP
jgi:hypothetical protein